MSHEPPSPATRLRPPATVMRLHRLGGLTQCRLSFARQLVRRMTAERWTVTRTHWRIDRGDAADMTGCAVYTVETGPRRYALAAFLRDRVAWFALCDGAPSPEDLARLAAQLPAGPGAAPARVSEREICVAQARLMDQPWDHALARLSAGTEPDAAWPDTEGELLLVGPVEGAGTLGTLDRDFTADRPEFQAPFQAEMLTLYLARVFARDLLQHLAYGHGGSRLAPEPARRLGVRMSAGLGLASFPVRHPCLFNNWIMAREEAIARVAGRAAATPSGWDSVRDLLETLGGALAARPGASMAQAARNARVVADLARAATRMAEGPGPAPRPWAELMAWSARALAPEAQETLASAMLEPHGALVDGLAHCMSDRLDRDFRLDGSLPVGRVRALIEAVHGWALPPGGPGAAIDVQAWSMARHRRDPRFGPRALPDAGPFDLPYATARAAVRAWSMLGEYPPESPVARALRDHPGHRGAIRRAQIAGFAPYAEIRDDLVARDLRPVDLLRATLAFFGATDFDAASDRRLTARLFAGAPYPEDLATDGCDRWIYPKAPAP